MKNSGNQSRLILLNGQLNRKHHLNCFFVLPAIISNDPTHFLSKLMLSWTSHVFEKE